MEISNKKQTKKIKRNFNLLSMIFIAAAMYLVWKELNLALIFLGVGFAIFLIATLVSGFNYISFSVNADKIVLKYYPVISLLGREYSTIEFKKELLYKYEINRSYIFSSITLFVRTKRGVAEYPNVSTTALSKNDLNKIEEVLASVLDSK